METDSSQARSPYWQEEFVRLTSLLRKHSATAPFIVVAGVEDESVEQEVIELLRAELSAQLILSQFGFEQHHSSLATHLRNFAPQNTDAVVATGLSRLPEQARKAALASLNRERDVLKQFGCTIVVLVPTPILPDFVRNAGDFWDCRSGYYIFQEPSRKRLRVRYLEQRSTYLKQLITKHSIVELGAVLQTRDAPNSNIERVFVEPLFQADAVTYAASAGLATENVDETTNMAVYAQLLAHESCTVILGDAGTGKSLFLKHLAVIVAQGPAVAAKKLHLPEEQAVDWLPVLLPLSSFAAALERQPDQSLADYLAQHFHGHNFGLLTDLAHMFSVEMEAGRCVFLLDGLDEIASAGRRREVVERIMDLKRRFPANCFLITSRVAGYDQAPLAPTCLHLVIRPLSQGQMKRLVSAWTETGPQNGERNGTDQATELIDLISRHEDLYALALNPLLLTILLHVFLRGALFPERRGELYRIATSALAETWALERSVSGQSVSVYWDGRPLGERQIIELLGPLAFWMHSTYPDGQITKRELIQRLSEQMQHGETMRPDRAWSLADEFVSLVQRSSGLLVEHSIGHFSFIHRTFQEYLAARYLVSQPNLKQLALQLVWDEAWEGVLVLVSDAFTGEHLSEYVETLLRALPPPTASVQNILVAGACLAAAGRTGANPQLSVEVRSALGQVAENADAGLLQRMRAGEILGILGDYRLGLSVVIPRGDFKMGISPLDLGQYPEPSPIRTLLQSSMPERIVFIAEYNMDRHPVTHAQYHEFINVNGYERREFWSEEGWEWLSQLQQKPVLPAYWFEYAWNRPNCPVIGVSWHEAEAYAKWAGRRLPSEMEWEKAARGIDGRTWPWGNTWNPDASNAEYAASQFSSAQLTPIGIHPKGVSPYGVWDMAGNVWEWTADVVDHTASSTVFHESLRILKGGAWNESRDHARCAARSFARPGDRYGSIGFRCAS